jgi:Caspase domain
MPSLYALLVAINAYPPPIDPLDGCLNDADAMEAMLRARFDADSLHLVRIQDSAATRQAVIDSFRSHLGQAKQCDLALFFFAGHGSQVPTGGQFATVEPTGRNSSIVCYDSRLPGGLDLVDKDMAVLISEVTANGAHLTTIFDSCHSGSMDRAVGVRRIKARPDAQPASKYLLDPAKLEAAIRDLPNPEPNSSQTTLAVAACSRPGRSGPHILFAACDTDQTAQEYIDPNTEKNHGAFTYFLTDTLSHTKAGLGYRELIHLIRAAMSVDVPLQTPKVESSGGDHMLDDLFLGFDGAAQTDYAIAAFSNTTNQWQLDRGATLNVAAGDRYALYPITAANTDLADTGKAFALATVTQVQPAQALLQPDPTPELDEGSQYKAVAADSSALDHVSTWKRRLALTNPNTQIPASALEFTLTVNPGTPQQQSFTCPPTDLVELPYRPVQESLYSTPDGRPTYVASIKNNGASRLYVTLLYFSADYSIMTGLLSAQTQFLDPGNQPVYTRSGNPLHASVPGAATETTDYILLIASTDFFDATLFAMSPIGTPAQAARGAGDPVPQHDFFTRRIALHITRTLQAAQENTVRRQVAPTPQPGPGALTHS